MHMFFGRLDMYPGKTLTRTNAWHTTIFNQIKQTFVNFRTNFILQYELIKKS